MRSPRVAGVRAGKKAVVAAACLAALTVIGALAGYLWIHRVEIFVIPARWRVLVLAVDELLQRKERDTRAEAMLDRKIGELIRLQRPEFAGGAWFRVQPVTTHEERAGFVLIYHGHAETSEPGLVPGIRFQAVGARGHLVGEPFQVPPHLDVCYSQGHYVVERGASTHDILRAGGVIHYDVSADARGIVPRGAVLLSGANAQPESTTVPVSLGISTDVKAWLARHDRQRLESDAVLRLLGSPHLGEVYRGLHAIELLGPAASALARPLLAHRDPDLRARAASVLGNDGSLGPELLPLLEDPAPRVRAAARFALLGAADAEIARRVWIELIREDHPHLEEPDFDRRRLASTEVAEAFLARLEKAELFFPGRSWFCFRPEHLRPLIPRMVAAWDKPMARESLVSWMAPLANPRLDTLLAEMLARRWSEGVGIIAGNPTVEILAWLLEREAPLQADGAVETLTAFARRRADIDPAEQVAAYFLLIRWGVPGTAEELLTKLRDPENDWIETHHHLMVWFDGHQENRFVWERNTPPELVPRLLELALERPEGSNAMPILEVLASQPAAVLAPLKERLDRLAVGMEERGQDLEAVEALLARIKAIGE